jgi:actin-like ATPase involved in cell morphogenesis
MDIGDAESVVAICSLDRHAEPTVVPSACFPTVVALGSRSTKPKIGYEALRVRGSTRLDLCFKCDPVTEYAQWRYQASGAILLFIEELHERVLVAHPELRDRHQVLIGCPAGWSAAAVERYEALIAESPRLTRAAIMPESRGALLQAWEFENLPAETLNVGVVVIDIGSSTIDCSVVRHGTASEHPASAAFGLRELDERIYQAYLDQHPAAEDRRQQYENDPVAESFVRYLCRLHKERALGGTPDLTHLPTDWDWLRREWEVLSLVDVPALLNEPDGWLDHYRRVLTRLAEDPTLPGTTVLLTGGGAQIPQVEETTEALLPDCHVQLAKDPMTGVAMGLAARGWLDQMVTQFETAAKDLLSSEPAMAKVRALYPDFLNKSFQYLKREFNGIPVETIAEFMAAPQASSELVLGRPLVKAWLQNLEVSEILDSFAESITSELGPDFDSLARQYSIRTGQWRPVIHIDPSELVASQDPKFAKMGTNTAFLSVTLRLAFGISVVSVASEGLDYAKMHYPESTAKLLQRFFNYRYRATLERITPRVTPEASSLFDKMVTQAIDHAVTDSLESVRAMLLDTRKQ